MALIATGCSRPPACYNPEATGPGWKRADLPHAAPHLAAPSQIDQFRSDEPTLLWGAWGHADQHHYPGETRYVLDTLDDRLNPWGEVVEVRFGALLGGAEVEAVGVKEYDEYPILRRTRMHQDTLWLPLEKGTRSVALTVHHHLRAAPDVNGRAGVYERLAPAVPHSLYYLDPGQGALELCEAPSRTTGVQRIRLEGSADEMALKPTPLTRLLYR